MNNQEAITAPLYELADPATCTHSGYFVPMGYEVFQHPENYIIVAGKMCIRCGKDFHEITRLSLPQPID